jgi:hypothetical protein
MNTKITLLLITALFLCSAANGQLNYKWSQSIGSSKSDFSGRTIADEYDNLYSLYQFQDTADVDPGPGVSLVIPGVSRVIALLKSDAEGNLLWAGQFHSAGTIIGGNLLEVQDNHIRLAITFVDSLTYENNGQTLLEYQAPGRNTCLLKLTTDGVIQEAIYIPTSTNALSVGHLITLPTGFTIINGSFDDTLAFPGAPLLVSNGKFDPFIMLLNPNNEVVWASSYGSSKDEYVGELHANNSSTFYMATNHDDTIVLNTTSGLKTFPSNLRGNAILIGINLQGEITHAVAVANEEEIGIEDIVVDKDGNIYICGYFEGPTNFAHATQTPVWHSTVAQDNGFVAKYTPEGMLAWVNVYPSTYYSYFISLVIERDTDLYIGGGAAGNTDLDPGPDSLISYRGDDSDMIIAKLQLDGTQLYAYQFESKRGIDLTTVTISDSRSEVILSGFFSDTIDCDFTEEQQILAPAGNADLFRIVFDEENVVTAVGSPVVDIAHTLFPNPATTHIQFESAVPVDFISIHAMDGQLIRSVQMGKAISGEVVVRDLVPGLYCVTLHAKDVLISNKIVKE